MFNLPGLSAQHSNLQLKLTKLLLKIEFVVSSSHYPVITGLQLEGTQILLTVIQTNICFQYLVHVCSYGDGQTCPILLAYFRTSIWTEEKEVHRDRGRP